MQKMKKIGQSKVFKVLLSLVLVAAILVPTFLAFAEGKSKVTIVAVTDSDENEQPVDLKKLHRNDQFRIKINLENTEYYQASAFTITYDNRYFEVVDYWQYSDLDNHGQSKYQGDCNNRVTVDNPNLSEVRFAYAVKDQSQETYNYQGTVGTIVFKVKEEAKGNYNFEFIDDTYIKKEIADGYYDETNTWVGATYKEIELEKVNANAFVEVPVTDISLNVPDEINMVVGQTKAIEVTPKEKDTTVAENATYQSSEQEVADVTGEGVITAKKTGKTEITVNAYGHTKKVTVNVTNPIKRLYFEEESVTIKGENQTKKLEVKTEPTNPDNAEVKWESLDSDIATVGEDGTVTSHKAGEATIKVTSKVNESISTTIKVVVVIPVTKAEIDKKSLSLNKNASEDVTITYEPAVANSEVTWTVDDSNIASVTAKEPTAGKFSATVKALRGGTTNVKGKITNCEDNVECEFTIPVTVNVPLESIKIQKDNQDVTTLSIYPTETATLTIVKNPDDATVSKEEVVEWKSNNGNVTVNNEGLITGVNAGTQATITATYAGKTASITVEVKTPVEGGNLSPSGDINLITKCNSPKGKCQEQMQVIFVDANGKTPDEKPQVTWGIEEGSATNVASVSSDGLVQALKVGNTIITATYKTFNGEVHTLKANVHVTVALEGISFEKENLTVHRNGKINLPKLVLDPADATVNLEDVVYEYDNDIISLDNGVITGIKKGSTTITAKLGNETAELTVIVDVPVTNIVVKKDGEEVSSLLLARDSSYNLTAEIDPVDADDQNVKWAIAEGSATDVITIDEDTGAINTLKKGTTKITVTAGGFTKTIDVEVNVPVRSFTANPKLNIYKGEVNKQTISTTIDPFDADDQEITWKSDDDTIATVDANGTVTGHKAGQTTITGTLKNGWSVEIEVTVSIIPLTDIEVVVPDQILKGRKTALSITPDPVDTTEFENIEYESGNEDIFTVDEFGNITGVKEGTATLTIKVGGITKEIEITITEIHAESIDAYVPSEKLGVGEEMLLQPYANPANCTDELTYTFTSSDEKIATIDENGKIKGIAPGKVTIKVTASNGMETEVEIIITEEPQFRVDDSTVIPNTGVSSPLPYVIISLLSLGGITVLGYKKYTLK